MVRLRVVAVNTTEALEEIVEKYYSKYDIIRVEYKIDTNHYSRYVAFIEYEDDREGREYRNWEEPMEDSYTEPAHNREMLFP